jgi:hypothetical protein
MSESAPFDYDEGRAAAIRPIVRELLLAALVTCEALYAR